MNGIICSVKAIVACHEAPSKKCNQVCQFDQNELRIGKKELKKAVFTINPQKPALFLAPMEGVTDAPMRALLTEIPGFTHCVTEFLRVSHMVLPAKCYRRHAIELSQGSKTRTGVPVLFQLLGGNAERMAACAAIAVEQGAKAIDINFGCPAPTVNKHDGGATLLKYPERIEAIVSAIRRALPAEIPVSAKMRLGFDDPNSIFENAKRAEAGGASWITIHGRTKTQGYTPPAYWAPMAQVRQLVKIPIVANGDIWTLDDFKKCKEQSGCNHFMLGRSALANPFLPQAIAHELGLLYGSTNQPNAQQWRHLLMRFIEIAEPLSNNPNYVVKRLKQWLRYAHLRGAFLSFDLVKTWESSSQFKDNIEKLEFK